MSETSSLSLVGLIGAGRLGQALARTALRAGRARSWSPTVAAPSPWRQSWAPLARGCRPARRRRGGLRDGGPRFNGIIHDFLMLNALKDTESTRSAMRLTVGALKDAFATSATDR
jgi:hypothetical protein